MSGSDGEALGVRAARNQALFRAINEELRGSFGEGHGSNLQITCECADTECVETLEIDLEHYTRIRDDATQFAVLPGHVYSEVEVIIAEHAGFVVVEKTGEAARVAVATDGMHRNA
jgi:hypothetical protein